MQWTEINFNPRQEEYSGLPTDSPCFVEVVLKMPDGSEKESHCLFFQDTWDHWGFGSRMGVGINDNKGQVVSWRHGH